MNDVPASGPGESVFISGSGKVLTDWSRDDHLVYNELDPDTGADLWYLPLAESESQDIQPIPFLTTEDDESFGQISPDGRWIAYVSNKTGGYEVWVKSFPSGAGEWRISTADSDTGTTQQPRWSSDGSELFYLTGAGGKQTMMAAPVSPSPSPGGSPVLAPRPLFEVRANAYAPRSGIFFYSVSSDGERFLISHVEASTEPVIHVLVNWEATALGGQ